MFLSYPSCNLMQHFEFHFNCPTYIGPNTTILIVWIVVVLSFFASTNPGRVCAQRNLCWIRYSAWCLCNRISVVRVVSQNRLPLYMHCLRRQNYDPHKARIDCRWIIYNRTTRWLAWTKIRLSLYMYLIEQIKGNTYHKNRLFNIWNENTRGAYKK
jgi:hypothetical protein